MPPGAREREQIVERRRRLDELRLRRPAATHRHDDDAAVAGKDARDVARSPPSSRSACRGRSRRATASRPAAATAGRSGSRRRRTAARARARATPRACAPAARAPARRRGRTTRSASDRVERVRRAGPRSRPRRAASRSRRRAAQRRRRTAAPRARRARPARSAHRRSGRSPLGHVERTSSSIRAVYFSYVFVSVENWMIRSCPWNG